MKKVLFSGIAFTALLMMGSAQAQTVGQDMHDAGHDTAHASKTVAHKTAHGTKVGYHKTVHATRKGYHKTERRTKKVVHKMDSDSSTTPQ
jgi:hypothetical protein